MAAVRRQRPQRDEVGPDCPIEIHYLFVFWQELHRQRGCGMTPNPISWSDMEAYSRLTDERLEPWEARAVMLLDNAFLGTVLSEGVGGT